MFAKNRCKQIESLLWGYTAQTLTPEQRATVEKHLAQCTTCRTDLETYQQIVPTVTTLRERSLPSSQTDWQQLRERIQTLPSASASLPKRHSMPNWRIWSGVLAAGCTVLVVLRLQPTPSPSVPQNTKPVQVAALLEKQGGNTVVKPNATATKKPTTQKPTETIHVQPAFEKTVTPAPKKSTPMIARRTPNRLEVARTDAGKEHSLKFALDGEMPIEQTQTRYVMGSVPSQEYTISPASYEEKDSKAW